MSAQEPIPTRAATSFDRRRFLDALLAVGFVSTAVAIVYPVSRFLIPPAGGEPASASAGKASSLRLNSAKIFKFGSRPGIVVRTADGDVRAFSAVCTHLDRTVQYQQDTGAAVVCVLQRDLPARSSAGSRTRGSRSAIRSWRCARRRPS